MPVFEGSRSNRVRHGRAFVHVSPGEWQPHEQGKAAQGEIRRAPARPADQGCAKKGRIMEPNPAPAMTNARAMPKCSWNQVEMARE